MNKPIICSPWMICVSCSVHFISAYDVRKGSQAVYPQTNKIRESDNMDVTRLHQATPCYTALCCNNTVSLFVLLLRSKYWAYVFDNVYTNQMATPDTLHITLTNPNFTAQHSTALQYTTPHLTAPVQDRTAQHHIAPQHNAQHSTAQHSTTLHHNTQHSTAPHRTTPHSTAQDRTGQHSTAQHSTTLHHNTTHSTAPHSTAQHRTAQHSTTLHYYTLNDTTLLHYCILLQHITV